MELWDRRASGRALPEPIVLTRGLYRAVAQDLAELESYDPEGDARVLWLSELARSVARVGAQGRRPRASEAVEAVAAFLLGREELLVPCGKDLAAGVEGGGW